MSVYSNKYDEVLDALPSESRAVALLHWRLVSRFLDPKGRHSHFD